MTVKLINEYTSHNLGDAAIYETLAQLSGASGAVSCLPVDARTYVRGLRADDNQHPTQAWVSVGGDIFNNARPWFLTRRFVQNMRALAAPPQAHTFLFGQSIPHSCRGLSLALLCQQLKRLSSVTVRDTDSHARLQARGVKSQLSWDLALAYQAQPGCVAAGRALFEAAGMQAQRAVLLSVREFDAMYPLDRRRFVASMAELASRLLARGHQPAVLIQADATGSDSDHCVAMRLRQMVPGLKVLNPFKLSGGHHALDALLGTVSEARAVVAVRFHTAVLRLLSGRQPYSLHYSIKGCDLARRLNLSGDSAAQFDPVAAVAGVEATIDRAHDVSPQAADVRQRFAAALAAARHSTAAQASEFAIPSQVMRPRKIQ